ncbi:MAG: ABC transporter permease [Pseudomonadota bacterium]
MTDDAAPLARGHGSDGADRPTTWGRIVGSAGYRTASNIVFASPRRQFLFLALIPIIWLVTQHVAPMVQMLNVSLLEAYPLTAGEEARYTGQNYLRFVEESVFQKPFFRTIIYSATLTLVTLLITYPVAYYLARYVKRDNQLALLLIILVPFWTGEIVRTYAIMILLGNNGAVNIALRAMGLIERPIPFMYTGFSVSVGLIYLTALYMLLPLYSALEKLPRSFFEAAADLGAGPITRFRRITIPLSLEGIGAGCTLVFVISTGYYGAPVLLGGPNSTVFAETIAGFFHHAGDSWPTGAAFAVIMFVTALGLSGLFTLLISALRKGDTK